MSGALVGCATNGEAAAPAEALAAHPPVVKSAVTGIVSAGDPYTYNPIGKRDPFRAFMGPDIDPLPPGSTPLQQYSLDELALVGVVWGIDRPRVLVQDPDQVGHVVEIGTYIGDKWGRVTQITPTHIVVTEEYLQGGGLNGRDELVTSNISMALPVEGMGSVR